MRARLPLLAVLSCVSAAAVAQTQPPLRDPRLYRSGIEFVGPDERITEVIAGFVDRIKSERQP